MKKLIVFIIVNVLTLSGCGGSKIKELENQLLQSQNKISSLESQLVSANSQINTLNTALTNTQRVFSQPAYQNNNNSALAEVIDEIGDVMESKNRYNNSGNYDSGYNTKSYNSQPVTKVVVIKEKSKTKSNKINSNVPVVNNPVKIVSKLPTTANIKPSIDLTKKSNIIRTVTMTDTKSSIDLTKPSDNISNVSDNVVAKKTKKERKEERRKQREAMTVSSSSSSSNSNSGFNLTKNSDVSSSSNSNSSKKSRKERKEERKKNKK